MKNISYKISVIILGLFLLMLFALNVRSVPDGIKKGTEEIQAGSAQRELTMMDKAQIYFVAINRETQDNYCFKQAFINMNGLTGRLLGKKQINEIIKLKNGYLSPVMEQADVNVQAEKTNRFARELEEEGIPFLFVETPYLIKPGNKELPAGVEDFSNLDADAYIARLREQGTDVLDLRQAFLQSEDDYYSNFYKTDHHWNSEGAFLAYQTLSLYLEELLQIDIPDQYLDRNQYAGKKYEKYFLGANGKRTGFYYNGVDDFEILYPLFETEIEVSIPDRGIERSGSYNDAVIDWSHVEKKDYYGANCYHAYIGGEYSLVEMKNENAPVNHRILLVKDSFALPVQAFLSTSFSEVDAMDLRVAGEKTVLEYANDNRPDIVIVMYNPYMLIDENAYEFE